MMSAGTGTTPLSVVALGNETTPSSTAAFASQNLSEELAALIKQAEPGVTCATELEGVLT